MHIVFLVEDSSGKALLEILLPKIIGSYNEPHTWRIISHHGIGHLPRKLNKEVDPTRRVLLNRLPGLLKGLSKTPWIDAIVVLMDNDKRDCAEFLKELQMVARQCGAAEKTLFRLAIEETEAWYFGDREALLNAYPQAKADVLNRYRQDSKCDTWEKLADAVYPGGSEKVKKTGWPLPGELKHGWARKIGLRMEPDRNASCSFAKMRDGLRRVVAGQ